MARKQGKAICVFSAKGGVGKTSTVLNMAGIYESIKKKVLIMDFDLSNGGISLVLNKGIDKSIYNAIDDINNNRFRGLEAYVTKYNDFIDYLPAPKDPRQALKIDSKYVKLLIDHAIYAYDIVLIDTTHSLSEININILDKVDDILFLVTNDQYDLKNLKSLISIFKDNGISNYVVALNNSIAPHRKYFSIYDIRNILKTNIDFVIPENFFNKNYDKITLNDGIYCLSKKIPMNSSAGIEIISKMAMYFIEKGGNKND